jgi:hypothetical protein
MALKEGTHFVVASYFDLDPGFGILEESMGTSAEMSTDPFTSRVMNMVGIMTNIGLAIIATLILFILQVYLPTSEQTLFLYDKKLHSLVEKKYRFLIGSKITLKLFLLIFILTNLFLVLFTIILYPYQGVL